jgi:HK97 family phage major capsid protein
MDTTVIDRKRSDLADVLTQIETLATREEFKPEDVAELQTRANGLKAQIQTLTEAMQARAASTDMDAMLQRAARTQEQRQREHVEAGESLGSMFTRSAQFSGYAGVGTTGRVETGLLTRALPMKSDAFPVQANPMNGYRDGAPLRTPLLNLVGGIPVSYGGFKVASLQVKGTGGKPGANPVVVTAEGAAKPSVELEEVAVPVNLDTLPVWTQVTRQALEDIPGLRARIDAKLSRLVLSAAEKRVADAILAATLPAVDGAGDLFAGIRNGIASVQDAGGVPTVLLINPQDAAAIDIAALLRGFPVDGTWGLTPVPSSSVTKGTAVVADIEAAVERYEKSSGVSVYITDSHASTFTENVFTILAELRDDTVVVDASAAVKVTAGTKPANP